MIKLRTQVAKIMRKLEKHKYYIINLTDIREPYYFNYPFQDEDLAKIVIEYYLKGFFEVYRGTKVMLLGLKPKRAPFPKYSPKSLRKYAVPGHRIKSLKMKGTGIRTHRFKKVWDEMPTEKAERRKIFNKDRSLIRHKLLK